MEKRPVSLTVIAVILILLTLLGLAGIFMMGSNPAMADAVAKMHISLAMLQIMGVLGAIINLLVAYGIFKGLPWSRVLYVAWGVISLAINAYTLPSKGSVVFGLIVLVVVSVFLWTNSANDWFQARGLMLSREGRRG